MPADTSKTPAQSAGVRPFNINATRADSLQGVLAKTVSELLSVQLGLGASALLEVAVVHVALYGPSGSKDVLWRAPMVWQNQVTHLCQAVQDSFDILARTHSRIRALESPFVPDGSRGAPGGWQWLGTPFGNRRVTAQIIAFPERRAGH